ncbi:polysaccharide deacetylase family protein [Marispirochaeta aestuarii]|uniref:polysaccharide deacetylase family protein n=1 Tax=Marispirochaeta aestuarii TaxID=1963862 RepID=UPI002ABE53AB|nr:polysaccharide deacetylase family protein [Marispirochaeta aestuarii]
MSIIRLNSGTWISPRRIISCLKAILALVCCTLLFSCAGISIAGTRVEEEPAHLRIYPARWYKDHTAACSVTFDDGTLDQYAVAAPELDKRGIRGTFFVVTGFVDRGAWQDGPFLRRLFSWEQARDLAWRGHEVASHTVHHIDLAAHPAEAAEELSRSRERLMDELPWVPAVSLGWPYWRSSDEAVALAENLYIAARAGGVKAGPEDWFTAESTGGAPGTSTGSAPGGFFHLTVRRSCVPSWERSIPTADGSFRIFTALTTAPSIPPPWAGRPSAWRPSAGFSIP